jgi:hypothetical protein
MNEIIINEVTFQCPQEDGLIFVPIKPICEALGIAANKQQETIKITQFGVQLRP